MKFFIISLLTFIILNLGNVFGIEPISKKGAEEKSLIFCTWEGFEVDKCASIWLIKRFIDKDAVIKFYPKGEVMKEGIPFDNPDAQLRRYHNMSTFESILKHYKLQNQKLIHIGKIIYDIEINIWEKKVFDETPMVQDAVLKIIMQSKENDKIIRRSCEYFDSLFNQVGN